MYVSQPPQSLYMSLFRNKAELDNEKEKLKMIRRRLQTIYISTTVRGKRHWQPIGNHNIVTQIVTDSLRLGLLGTNDGCIDILTKEG